MAGKWSMVAWGNQSEVQDKEEEECSSEGVGKEADSGRGWGSMYKRRRRVSMISMVSRAKVNQGSLGMTTFFQNNMFFI